MDERGSRFLHFFRELRRRKVMVSAVAYVAISITVIELSARIFEALLLPAWGVRLVTVLLLMGFPFVLVFAWIFDVTAGGIVRTGSPDEQEAAGRGRGAGSARSLPGKAGVTRPTVRRVGGAATRAPAGESAPRPEEEAPPPEPVREAPDPARVRKAALSHVRHELRTPINAIIGYSEMLLEDEEEEGSQLVGDLARVRDAGRKLLSLVDGILHPDRLASRSGEEDLEDIGSRIRADLRNPVNAVVGYTEMLIESAEESGREHVVPDLERILEAARRLLEMSTDIVQVATGAEAAGAPTERLSEASVLTEEVLSKIRPAGVVGTEGEGNLLVVDDNAFNRDLLSRQLARQGFVVATAENGREALELLAERPFDLVLLDIIMPEMDGIETLRRIKGDARLRGLPVIMLSSLDEVDSAIRCIELGAEDYLSKPFHPTLLQARIGANLEVGRLRERERSRGAHDGRDDELVERLLRSAFPDCVAERVRAGETGFVEAVDDASVLWCDLEAAARGGPRRDPAETAARLQGLLAAFDEGADHGGVETICAQGHVLVAAAGLPTPCPDHARRVAELALRVMDAARRMEGGETPALRIGIHSGSAAAGVIGEVRLGYRIWGDAVDLARSLGADASAGTIRVSPATFGLLQEEGYDLRSLGVREIRGRGQMRTYVLEGRTGDVAAESAPA